ncbi:MAG: hypothetical protein WCE62_12115 [Polyangiales bacterium]
MKERLFFLSAPYLDGNGRIGRLLVTLLLEEWNLLSKPLLYLSLFFKRNRDDYYRLMNAVRIEGDWEGWIRSLSPSGRR